MLKKLGILSSLCLGLLGCTVERAGSEEYAAAAVPTTAFQQPSIKMPSSVIVCRAKQCAAAKLSMSKEFVYNTLLHMFDSNARQKALVCAADSVSHACTEEYVSIPVSVGITPAYMYIDDVKITDVSISRRNTSALNLVLNWGVSYNGQTPVCRPSKTLLYAKNVNNIIMEDNGYSCKMTTIGTSTVKTLFAIDYIDLDFGYIGGFYSIGLSGPAFGGGSGYMILRLPKDISLEAKDFQYVAKNKAAKAGNNAAEADNGKVLLSEETSLSPVPEQAVPASTSVSARNTVPAAAKPARTPAPNVDTIIKYQHQSLDYDKAKKEIARKKKRDAQATEYEGVKVFPVPLKASKNKDTAPEDKNSLAGYIYDGTDDDAVKK